MDEDVENVLGLDQVVGVALAAVKPEVQGQKLQWVELELIADGTVRWNRDSYAPQ